MNSQFTLIRTSQLKPVLRGSCAAWCLDVRVKYTPQTQRYRCWSEVLTVQMEPLKSWGSLVPRPLQLRGLGTRITPLTPSFPLTCAPPSLSHVQLAQFLEVFDVATETWEQQSTTGTPPLGLYNNAHTILGE